jgi:hypothetical protein
MSTRYERMKRRWTGRKCWLCGDERDLHGTGRRGGCAGYDDYFPELGGGPPCSCRGFFGWRFRFREWITPTWYLEWRSNRMWKKELRGTPEGQKESE